MFTRSKRTEEKEIDQGGPKVHSSSYKINKY